MMCFNGVGRRKKGKKNRKKKYRFLGESKVLQYFSNVRYNSVIPDAFVESVKLTNYIELWDTKFAWNSLRADHRISHHGLERRLGIHAFRHSWHYLIVEALAARVKVLEPSGYCAVINYAFSYGTTKVLGCFVDVMAHFEHLKRRFPN